MQKTQGWGTRVLIWEKKEKDCGQGWATRQATYTGNTIRFRHYDWLGSARFESNMAEAEYGDVAYAPFGETYSIKNTPYLSFTGQQQDTVSGTYDFLYRKYNPVQGRWISPDPAGVAAVNPTNPQSWNRYASVLNNPLAFVDLFGLVDDCGGPCTPITYTNGACSVNITYSQDEKGYDIPSFDVSCSGGGGHGQPLQAPPADQSIFHRVVCYLASPLLKAAGGTNGTVGVGTGGNAGVLFGFGGSLGLGVQAVSDPNGNIGVAINVNAGFLGFGASAMGGAQASASTSQSIFGLSGWSLSGDVSAGAGPAVDLAVSQNFTVGSVQLGPTAATVTVGPGIGTKAAVGSIGYSFVPQSLSTKCGG